MKSSFKIIKNLERIEEKKSCVIPISDINTFEEELQQTENDYEKIIEEAKVEAKKIRDEAIKQAKTDAQETLEELKKQTYDEAYEMGFKQGVSKGHEEGYLNGEKESELIRKQAKMVLDHAHQSAKDMIDKNEDEIIDLAVHIAEQIILTTLSKNDESLIKMAQDACSEFKNKKHVIISVNPSKKALFDSNIEVFEKICPNTIFTIIEDEKISDEGCVLESDAQVVDTQITGQLEKVKEALMEMEANNGK